MIVADTHILIWDSLTPERLSDVAKEAIRKANAAEGILISDISLWEIAMLIQKGRIEVDTDCQSFLNLIIQANQIHVCPITEQIATLTTELPDTINTDPADRLIIATALANDASLVTADRNLRNTSMVATIW